MQQYPSVRYHRSGATRIVNHSEDHEALMAEGDWADTPAAFPPEPAPTVCKECGRALAEPEPEAEANDEAPAGDAKPAKKRAPKPKAE